MNDQDTPLQKLRDAVLTFAQERDWEQFHTPKNLVMALAAESGELLEHFLWIDSEQSRKVTQNPQKLKAIREELADIVIYALEFANITQTDLTSAIEEKMQQNAEKYPIEKSKGRSAKYTEL